MPRITSPNRIELSDDEKKHLFALIHKGVNSARVISRARILTKLAKGHFNVSAQPAYLDGAAAM